MATIGRRFTNEHNLFFENAHPFCELLNVGVLGIVKRDPVTHKKIQSFRKPQEFDWKMQNILDQETTYLIHPSLHESITSNRTKHYYASPTNIIGESLEWDDSARLFPQVYITYSHKEKDRLEPVLERLGENLTTNMPCAFWYDRDSIRLKQDSLLEIECGAADSDIVLLFLTRRSIENGWLTQEWMPKYERDIHHSNVQVLVCMLDTTPSDKLPKPLSDFSLTYLSGYDDELDEPINALIATMALCLKDFWHLD